MAAKQPTPVKYVADSDAKKAAVSFDGELLRSAVENLVRNASESYEDGGVADAGREIELALFRDRGYVVIAVRDRGKGIPQEMADKVFDPFFTDKVHGSGVGLSLSRRLVEAAGGVLSLLPRTGGGREARITLPPGGTP